VEGAFTGPLVLCFLVKLLREIDGRILLVWDGAPIHRTAETRDFLRRPDVAARLAVMPLPPYAPELNPEELVNAHIKSQRLANHAPSTTVELRQAAMRELRRAAQRPTMLVNILTSSRHGLLRAEDLSKAVM
jgi:transposase